MQLYNWSKSNGRWTLELYEFYPEQGDQFPACMKWVPIPVKHKAATQAEMERRGFAPMIHSEWT